MNHLWKAPHSVHVNQEKPMPVFLSTRSCASTIFQMKHWSPLYDDLQLKTAFSPLRVWRNKSGKKHQKSTNCKLCGKHLNKQLLVAPQLHANKIARENASINFSEFSCILNQIRFLKPVHCNFQCFDQMVLIEFSR